MQPSLWLTSAGAASHFDPDRQSFQDRRRWSRMAGVRPRGDWAASRALLAHIGASQGARSLAHSHGIAAIALAPEGTRLGVDLEQADPRRDCVKLARFAFAPDEVAQLVAMHEADRPERFYVLWTLKEACIKALGLTLLEGLRRCRFALRDARWQATIPTTAAWAARVYRPRPALYLAVMSQPPTREWLQHEWPEPAALEWPTIATVDSG